MEQRRSSQATGEHGEAEASREWRFLALVSAVLFGIQLLVTIVVGIYFYTQLRQQRRAQPSNRRESGREYERLQKMRALKLSEPLAERVRPTKFSDIVGQEDGIKSLKAILCGKNPQHVLIYGPPGVGKTCAARLVLEKKEDKAFALVRPPGHHSMRVVHGNRGFCNINNEAVMVEYIRDHYPHPDGRPLRIAIVDTDVHHGDGTQDVFWNDPHTLFISLHQDGRTLYPGTGFPQECGGPAALGRTINIPLPPETSDEGYLYAVEHAVLPILAEFKPDLVINSAGQDNHFTDPLANMRLSAQGYAALNKALNPDIAVLEGGYAIRGALPYVNMGICLALAGLSAEDIREPGWTPSSTRQRPEVGQYIAKLCDQIVELYRRPPAQPAEGREEDGW